MYSGRSLSIFQRNVLSPSSGRKGKWGRELPVFLKLAVLSRMLSGFGSVH
jgi:hypothetical protein